MAVATADALTAGGYKVRTTKDASSGSSSVAFFDTFLVDVKVLNHILYPRLSLKHSWYTLSCMHSYAPSLLPSL